LFSNKSKTMPTNRVTPTKRKLASAESTAPTANKQKSALPKRGNCARCFATVKNLKRHKCLFHSCPFLLRNISNFEKVLNQDELTEELSLFHSKQAVVQGDDEHCIYCGKTFTDTKHRKAHQKMYCKKAEVENYRIYDSLLRAKLMESRDKYVYLSKECIEVYLGSEIVPDNLRKTGYEKSRVQEEIGEDTTMKEAFNDAHILVETDSFPLRMRTLADANQWVLSESVRDCEKEKYDPPQRMPIQEFVTKTKKTTAYKRHIQSYRKRGRPSQDPILRRNTDEFLDRKSKQYIVHEATKAGYGEGDLRLLN
jgi:hypothetical protein